MKKLILLTTAILIGNLAFSQVLPGFSIGPKVGASFSKFTTDKEQIQEEIENSFFSVPLCGSAKNSTFSLSFWS